MLKHLLKGHDGLTFAQDAYDAVTGADLLLLITEWNEFKEIDLIKVKSLMKGNSFIDGRNIYDPEKAHELGFAYKGVGR